MATKRAVRTPVQARAKATVDKLCMAAVRIIEQGGLPAFNTNAVAAEAGVSIQTLYAYFPDKYDILREIFRREQDRYSSVLQPYLSRLGEDADWRRTLQTGLREAASSHAADPGFSAVRNAMVSVPGMSSLTDAADDELAAALAGSLRKHRSDLTQRSAMNSARMLVAMIGAGLERATVDGRVERPLLNELVATVEAAVERILQPEPVHS